ncbi:glycoside hydrolase family 2 protein [Marinilabilia salmonicolor]|uniref:glycoside hydrolase family 2 protein n=1 Tax=Marinilabilia salmonicolor TaxID=989 RepID=UPI00029AEC09|nr:glycoside hydrolase family 2 TIM barrel-domain containing protein [Marinilabilia salmonicolor]
MNSKKRFWIFTTLMSVFFNTVVFAQSTQIINVDNRNTTTLNGVWKYLVDPYEVGYYDYRRVARDTKDNPDKSEAFFLGYRQEGPSERVEYDFTKADNILVPGDWNSQKEKLFYYEGTVWYYKSFDYNPKDKNSRQFVHFGAVNYEADVYLNGEKLGKHIGGFTPFNFEITQKLRAGKNFLIVKVDNSRGIEKVPTVNTDWWNYGGITRDIRIVEVEETFIQDYYLQLKKGSDDMLEFLVKLNGSNADQRRVVLSIPKADIEASLITNSDGIGRMEIRADRLKLWSPEIPFLYDIQLRFENTRINDQIGFRTIEVEDTDILLNGKPVFLRGISIHEENGMRGGRAYSKEDARILLGWAKELGCNFVRLAHYPHNEPMIRVADELGLMVWSEVPVYWTIQWHNENTYNNAHAQLVDMIGRDKNRASVIVWSVANETPVSEYRTKFLRRLIAEAHQMDPVRLVSAALERHTKPGTDNVQVVEDPLQEYVDIIAFNEYIGWYDGRNEKIKTAAFEIEYQKPVIISEFGAGALQGNHGSAEELWTEEYQEELYRETLKMLENITQLRGITPWILADFRSPRRVLPDIQDGWNRKGLISPTGNKKKAFFILKDYYEWKKKQFE